MNGFSCDRVRDSVNPFRANACAVKRNCRWIALLVWNLGFTLGLLLLFSESSWIISLGAAIGTSTCCFLGFHAIQLGCNHDLLSAHSLPESIDLVDPAQFVQIGFSLLVFTVFFIIVGIARVYSAI